MIIEYMCHGEKKSEVVKKKDYSEDGAEIPEDRAESPGWLFVGLEI